MRHLPCSLIVSLLLVTTHAVAQPAGQATSEDVKEVERLYADGVALFKANNFEAALEKFNAAYELIPVANLNYNIGRCQEALGEIKKATAAYKRCMHHAECSPEAKLQSAERYERLIKTRVDAAGRALPDRRSKYPGGEEPSSISAMSVMKWTTLGLGVALTVAGGVVYGLGASDHNKVQSLDGFDESGVVLDMTRTEATGLLDDGKTKKTAGVALLSAAGAALVTSAILFLIPSRDDTTEKDKKKKSSSLQILTVAGPSGGHLLLRGGF